MSDFVFWDDLSSSLPKRDVCYTSSTLGEKLFLGTSDGCVLAFDPGTGSVQEFGLSSRPIKGICSAPTGHLLAYDSVCVYELAPADGGKRVIQSSSGVECVAVIDGPPGILCVGTTTGLFLSPLEAKTAKLTKPVLQTHVQAMATAMRVIFVVSKDGIFAAYSSLSLEPLDIRVSPEVTTKYLCLDGSVRDAVAKTVPPLFRVRHGRVYLSLGTSVAVFSISRDDGSIVYECSHALENGVEVIDMCFSGEEVVLLCRDTSAPPLSPGHESLAFLSPTLESVRCRVDLELSSASDCTALPPGKEQPTPDSRRLSGQIIGIHGSEGLSRCPTSFTRYRPALDYIFLVTRLGLACVCRGDETDRLLMHVSGILTSGCLADEVRVVLRETAAASGSVAREIMEREVFPALIDAALRAHDIDLVTEVLHSPLLNPTALGASLITSLVLEFLAAQRVGEVIKYIPGYGEQNMLSPEVYNVVLWWTVQSDVDLALTLARRWSGCYSYQLLSNAARELVLRSPDTATGLQRLILFCALKLKDIPSVYRLSFELNGPVVALRVAYKYNLRALAFSDLDRLVCAEIEETGALELAEFCTRSLISSSSDSLDPNRQLLEFMLKEAKLIAAGQMAAGDLLIGELFLQSLVTRILTLVAGGDPRVPIYVLEACLRCSGVVVATALVRQRSLLVADLLTACVRLFLRGSGPWDSAAVNFLLGEGGVASLSPSVMKTLDNAHINATTFLAMFQPKDAQTALRILAMQTGTLLYAKLISLTAISLAALDVEGIIELYRSTLGIASDKLAEADPPATLEIPSVGERPLVSQSAQVEANGRTCSVESCRTLIKAVFDTLTLSSIVCDSSIPATLDKKNSWLSATTILLPLARNAGIGFECVDRLLSAPGSGVTLDDVLDRFGDRGAGNIEVLLGVKEALGLSSDILERALEIGRDSAELAFLTRWRKLRRGVLVPAAPRCSICGKEIREEIDGLPVMSVGGSTYHSTCVGRVAVSP